MLVEAKMLDGGCMALGPPKPENAKSKNWAWIVLPFCPLWGGVVDSDCEFGVLGRDP